MMQFVYLSVLVISLAGLTTVDRRFKLAFWRNGPAAFKTLVISVGFFLAWDMVGISHKIFFVGQTVYTTGWQIVPNLPIEELFFLSLLSYLTLLLSQGFRWKRI